MQTIRIDVRQETEEEKRLRKEQTRLVFQLNHTMPMTPEYDAILARIFPNLGEGGVVNAPITVVRPHMVRIGSNVVIMNGCLMMAAGGITIGDGALIAANVQLLSNNHDPLERDILICKPVVIGANAWIGAGATILPGVTVGENAIVGAASVVARDVPPDAVVAGNPARIIKKIA